MGVCCVVLWYGVYLLTGRLGVEGERMLAHPPHASHTPHAHTSSSGHTTTTRRHPSHHMRTYGQWGEMELD